MLRVRQFLVLTRLTAVEALRQPICLLLTASCVLGIAATPLAVIHKFGEEGKLARDSGLAFLFVFGLLVAGYAAGTSLARELRTGTASAVLSKPVTRETLFLAKVVGVAGVVLVFAACALPALLLCERVDERFHFSPQMTGYITDWQTGFLLLGAPFAALLAAGAINYTTRRPFASTAFAMLLPAVLLVFALSGLFDRTGRFSPYDLRVDWRLMPAGLLIVLALLVFVAIAVSLSTRLSTPAALGLCVVVFLAGLMSDYLFGRHAGDSRWLALLYGITPNWQHFWAADALSGEGTIPWRYVGRSARYAAAYSAAVLCLGLVSFRHREVS